MQHCVALCSANTNCVDVALLMAVEQRCSVEKPPTLFPISANSVQVCEYIYISSGTAPPDPDYGGQLWQKLGEREAFRLQTLGLGTRDGGSRRITSCWLYRHGADTTLEYTDTDGQIGNKHICLLREESYIYPAISHKLHAKHCFPTAA